MGKTTHTDGTDGGLPTDRRSFMLGLGATAAGASFAPFVTARAVAVVPIAAAPVPAVFWDLPYVDVTGTAIRYAPPERYAAEARARDFDPHAELLAGG